MKKQILSLAFLVFSITASADPVRIGVDDADVTVISNISEAAYRPWQPGWDQMLSNGANPVTVNDMTSTDFTGATALNNTMWDFSISYESGDDGVQGFTFVLDQVGGQEYSGTLVYDLNNPLNGQTPTGTFNAIEIEARAGPLLDQTSYIETGYVDITDLIFTSALSSNGAFENPLNASWPAEERDNTWVTSSVDLSGFDWILTGTVTIGHDCNGLGSAGCLTEEDLRINLRVAEATVVPPEPELLNVQIDVLPGDAANKVYPNKTGKLPVAVLSSADFDATQVNPATLRFGPAEAPVAEAVSIEDVDGINGNDTLARFNVQESGILCNDTEVALSGETYAGDLIAGVDTIDATECDTGCHAY